MKRLFCLVSGHQRTLMAFTSNRFSCRRCGADLGRDIPVMPSSPAAMPTPSQRPVPDSPVARHGVRHRDWAVRLRRPRLAARPHANVRRSRLALAAHCDRAPTLLDPDRQASLQSWICALGGPGSG
ncbi:MAG: hypothetical protein K0S99_3803 [Thermomicrobiales bacterium]|nr:hypothetical protein [Thermomicrobiales bacterium]